MDNDNTGKREMEEGEKKRGRAGEEKIGENKQEKCMRIWHQKNVTKQMKIMTGTITKSQRTV